MNILLKYLAYGLSLICFTTQAAEIKQEHCLALASYYEVRAHPVEYLNVFHVINNRSKLMNLNYCQVVFQKNTVKISNRWKTLYQFSWVPYYRDKTLDEKIYQLALNQARDFIKNKSLDSTKGALYFTRHQDNQTWFSKNYRVVLKTQRHVYYGIRNIKTTS